MSRCASVVLACVVLVVAVADAAEPAPPELAGYRLDDYRSPTPATVDGRASLSTTEAHRLWKARSALFIDVLPAPRRPDGLPTGAVWAPRPRLGIPGSIWLPDLGRGALSPELEARFRGELERITAGNRAASLIFYCLADCWMSWNATKRVLSWDYSGAQWYGEGTDGWQAAGYPLAEIAPQSDQPR